MKLKKVNLYGFKSFADKTTLIFEPQIIALVGPNGCGKSNIVDAIFWLFQRSSLKNLRAREKQDLIFKGNNTRKSSGFAEVEIILEKTDELEFEENEINIKKRVFQSGETQIYLQNKPITFKELEKYYIEHGISSSEYSIIAQGSVENIIASKPEDKRVIIEDAAGIRKYKQERDFALNKLKKSQENLSQLDILMDEIKNEMDKLEIQAQKAKQYKDAKNSVVENEKKLFLTKYLSAKKDLERIHLEHKDFEIKNKELLEKIEKLDEQSREKKQTIEQFGKDVVMLREKTIKLEGEISSSENAVSFYRQIYEDLQTQIQSKETQIKAAKRRAEDIEKLLGFDHDEEDQKLEELQDRLYEYEDKLTDMEETISKRYELNEETKKEIGKLEVALKEYLNQDKRNVEQQFTEINRIIIHLEKLFQKEEEHFKEEFEKFGSLDISLKSKIRLLNDMLQISAMNDKKNLSLVIEELEKLNLSILHTKELIDNHYKIFIEAKQLFFSQDSIFKKREEVIQKIDETSLAIEKMKKDRDFIESEINHMIKTKEVLFLEKSKITENIARLNEKIRNYSLQKEQYKKDEIELEYQINAYDDEMKALKNKLQDAKEKGEENIDKIQKIINEKGKVESQIQEYEVNLDSLSQQLVDIQHLYNELFTEKRKINEVHSNFQANVTKLETQLETLRNIYFDNYREDILTLDLETIQLSSETTIRKLMKESQTVIDEIGEVNLLALDEFEEIKKRYEFLNEQRTDVLTSIEDLNKVIEKLNFELNDKFLNAFNTVNENFQLIFQRIFGGGKANLFLTDEENLLETGVDIKIQPPGKKITYLNLLSGGEKTMSAISLLFALFLYTPSPFCIMDEVDAPLDELNVERYKKLIQEFSKETKFIIISHNKLTLEIADILYGVTMEESGVSKLVSAKLEKLDIES